MSTRNRLVLSACAPALCISITRARTCARIRLHITCTHYVIYTIDKKRNVLLHKDLQVGTPPMFSMYHKHY